MRAEKILAEAVRIGKSCSEMNVQGKYRQAVSAKSGTFSSGVESVNSLEIGKHKSEICRSRLSSFSGR